MTTTLCRYYRSGDERDLSVTLHRESVRRGPGSPLYPVLERLDLTGLWLPVDAATAGRGGFVALDGLEPIDVEEAARVYRRLGDLRLIPPTTPLPPDLAAALGADDEDHRLRVGPWLLMPLLASGTLLAVVALLALLVIAWTLLV